MKKRYFAILIALLLGIGTVLGAFVAMFIWQTNMNMRLIGAPTYGYEVELRDGQGAAPITSHDWGDFYYSEQKILNCSLYYLGNATDAEVLWNTTGLPSGWIVMLNLNTSTPVWVAWNSNQPLTFAVGEVRLVMIQLIAPSSGELNQPLGFTLNLVSGKDIA